MTNQPLPDRDHVSRYCKPSTVNNGVPLATAFTPRENEPYLSVNWLEYFHEASPSAAMKRVREAFDDKNYQVRRNGMFAVLNVGAVKAIAFDTIQMHLGIEHMPLADDPSHCGIKGYTCTDLAVAAAIATLPLPRDLHPAVVSKDPA